MSALVNRDLRDLIENLTVKESTVSLSGLPQYLSLLSLQKGQLLDDEKIKDQAKKLGSKGFSITKDALSKVISIFTKGGYGSPETFEPLSVFQMEKEINVPGSIEKNLKNLFYLESFMKSLNGEVSEEKFNEGTVVAGILRLPYREKLVRSGSIPVKRQEESCRYIQEVKNLTEKYPHFFSQITGWFNEIVKDEGIFVEAKELAVENYDISTYARFADEARKICKGSEIDLDALSKLLYRTKIRDSKTFEVDGDSIKRRKLKKVSFEDVAGSPYRQNVKDIKDILDRVKKKKEMGIFTILQGPPGNGKTLSLKAALSELPENARGIVFKNSDFEGAMDYMKHLGRLYPDLYFLGVFDEIDLHIKTRDITPSAVSAVLNLDSIDDYNKLPKNIIITGATNRAGYIDPALIERSGRVRYVFNFPKPEDNVRKEVIEFYSERKKIKVDVSSLVKTTEGMSCDDIASFFREAETKGMKALSADFIQRQKKQINERKELIRDSSDLYKKMAEASKKSEVENSLYY